MPSLTIRQRKSRLHRQMLQKPNMGLASWKGARRALKETGIVDVVKTDAYADISVFNSSYKSTGLNCQ